MRKGRDGVTGLDNENTLGACRGSCFLGLMIWERTPQMGIVEKAELVDVSPVLKDEQRRRAAGRRRDPSITECL